MNIGHHPHEIVHVGNLAIVLVHKLFRRTLERGESHNWLICSEFEFHSQQLNNLHPRFSSRHVVTTAPRLVHHHQPLSS